jgi:hypothetical protein
MRTLEGEADFVKRRADRLIDTPAFWAPPDCVPGQRVMGDTLLPLGSPCSIAAVMRFLFWPRWRSSWARWQMMRRCRTWRC